MAIGTTNIGLNAIITEANPAPTLSNISAGDLFRKSYFEGPNGSNTISYNAWGQYGSSVGADRIYGLSTANSDLNFGAYSGLTYFYDNSSYKSAIRVRNNLQAPPFPPPTPPSANDVVLELKIYDSTSSYMYMYSNVINANAQVGGYDQTFVISQTDDPMINLCYWVVSVNTDQFFPSGPKTLIVDINGTNYVNTSLAASTAFQTFTFSTYGTPSFAATGQGYSGFYFNVTIQ